MTNIWYYYVGEKKWWYFKIQLINGFPPEHKLYIGLYLPKILNHLKYVQYEHLLSTVEKCACLKTFYCVKVAELDKKFDCIKTLYCDKVLLTEAELNEKIACNKTLLTKAELTEANCNKTLYCDEVVLTEAELDE